MPSWILDPTFVSCAGAIDTLSTLRIVSIIALEQPRPASLAPSALAA